MSNGQLYVNFLFFFANHNKDGCNSYKSRSVFFIVNFFKVKRRHKFLGKTLHQDFAQINALLGKKPVMAYADFYQSWFHDI